MNRPPSPLSMLLSRHTRRREFIAGLGGFVAGCAGAAAACAQHRKPRPRLSVVVQHRYGHQRPADQLRCQRQAVHRPSWGLNKRMFNFLGFPLGTRCCGQRWLSCVGLQLRSRPMRSRLLIPRSFGGGRGCLLVCPTALAAQRRAGKKPPAPSVSNKKRRRSYLATSLYRMPMKGITFLSHKAW
jgi:hypothetical protein